MIRYPNGKSYQPIQQIGTKKESAANHLIVTAG